VSVDSERQQLLDEERRVVDGCDILPDPVRQDPAQGNFAVVADFQGQQEGDPFSSEADDHWSAGAAVVDVEVRAGGADKLEVDIFIADVRAEGEGRERY
jgi:hypothetical protein